MKPHARIEYYVDERIKWRWRIVGADNEVITTGHKGYVTKTGIKRAIARFVELVRAGLPVEEV